MNHHLNTEQINSKIASIVPDVIALRRAIHQTPEIGLETTGTRQKVLSFLQNTNLTIWENPLQNELVADLKGQSSTTICFRADMDALPIFEQTGLDYQSRIPGQMHACGHDGHTAILMGAALVLNQLKADLPVSVRFIFQPGEEMICGAKALVENGVCNGVTAVYALHNWPGLPSGQVACRAGALFAALAKLTITLTGKGCHGARPEEGNNPIPVAAKLIHILESLHHQHNSADGSVISVCSISSGESYNVIPDTAVIKGTTRYLTTEIGNHIEAEIKQAAAEIATATGVQVEVNYDKLYGSPVTNSEQGYQLVKRTAQKCLGIDYWNQFEKPSMVSEDFAFFLEGREGAMFLIGNGIDSPGLHMPNFSINEQILADGIKMFVWLALNHWTV